MSRRTLIVAQPRNPATGAVQTVRLGGGGRAALYHDGQHYRAGVVRSPRFAARLAFDEDGWTGGSLPTTGSVVFAPAPAALLAELAGLYWKGAAITVLVGDEAGPFVSRLTGTVADAASAGGRLVLTIADLSFGIDKPLTTARFAGTGGIEGVSEAAGRIKRRSWGRVFNVEGRLIDKANSIYEFGDPARPLQGFDALRDKGSAGTFTGIAWQGSIAATFAALQAAAAPAGGGVVAPSIACAKWWTQPSGPLTADLRGETAGGYVEDVVGIAARILTAAAGPAIANAAAAAAWRTGVAGLHVGDENETAAQALDRLLLGASLLWVLDPAGAIMIRQIGFGASVETLDASSSARQRQLKPTRSRRIGYRRNHRQHSDGEIAAVLRGTDVAYADNTPIDSLKPQEAGANKTETRTASSITGQGSLATQSAAQWGSQIAGRPLELTDGRIPLGLSGAGALQGGLQAASGFILKMSELFAGAAGTNIAPNPEFRNGLIAGWSLYDNAASGRIVMNLIADNTAPNSSGVFLRFTYNGSGTPNSAPTPGFGGVVQAILPDSTTRPGAFAPATTLLFKITARIPIGRRIGFGFNSLGTGGSTEMLTSDAGTGDWQTYVLRIKVGSNPSGNQGYIFYQDGPNTPFNADIARFDIIDVSSAQRTFLGNTFADETGVARFAADLVTLLGQAAGFTGQGALATQNTVTYSTQIGGLPRAIAPAGFFPSGYLKADEIFHTDGSRNLDTWFPQDQNANRTETRQAASIAGQGTLATQSTVTYSTQISGLPGAILPANMEAGRIAAGNVALFGVDTLSNRWPQEANSNRTETRIAAGLTSQGPFATAPTLTRSNVGSYFNLNAFSLNYTITRADGASIVTESLSITSLGISAGFAGQGALASKNAVDWNSADIINKPALSVNRITRSHTAAPGAYIEIQLAPNETVPVQVYWRAQRTAGADGDIAGAVEVSDNGSSWNTVLTTAPAFVGISEPAGRNASGFFTNTTGFTRTFAFRFNATGATAGLDFIPLGQNFVSVG